MGIYAKHAQFDMWTKHAKDALDGDFLHNQLVIIRMCRYPYLR